MSLLTNPPIVIGAHKFDKKPSSPGLMIQVSWLLCQVLPIQKASICSFSCIKCESGPESMNWTI